MNMEIDVKEIGGTRWESFEADEIVHERESRTRHVRNDEDGVSDAVPGGFAYRECLYVVPTDPDEHDWFEFFDQFGNAFMLTHGPTFSYARFEFRRIQTNDTLVFYQSSDDNVGDVPLPV